MTPTRGTAVHPSSIPWRATVFSRDVAPNICFFGGAYWARSQRDDGTQSWVFEKTWKPQRFWLGSYHTWHKSAMMPPKVLIFIYKIQPTPLWHPDYRRPFASQCTNMATLQKQCWCNLSQQWKRKLTFSTTFGCDGTLFVPGMLPNTPISRGR